MNFPVGAVLNSQSYTMCCENKPTQIENYFALLNENF